MVIVRVKINASAVFCCAIFNVGVVYGHIKVSTIITINKNSATSIFDDIVTERAVSDVGVVVVAAEIQGAINGLAVFKDATCYFNVGIAIYYSNCASL